MSDTGLYLLLASVVALAGALLFKHLHVSRSLDDLRKEADHMRLQIRLQREEESKRLVTYRKKIEALKGAVEQGAIRTVFQPVVHLGTGRAVGTEALSRFADDRGPETWFREAAALGIEVQLEMAAVDRALGQLDGTHDGFVCLNVSPSTLSSSQFKESLLDCNLDRKQIVVEITEHAVVENYERVRDSIAELRSYGIRLAVDDVGAGFSSLRHILQLHPNIVKLDRSLITGLNNDKVRLHMVAALARVAQQMDAVVIAEGIEDVAEVNALWSIGVELGQGFLLCVPEADPLAEIEWTPERIMTGRQSAEI